MKKVFLTSISLIMLFANTASAQTASSSRVAQRFEQSQFASTSAEMIAQEKMMQEKLASTTADIQNKKAELQSDIAKRIGKNLGAQQGVIAEKFETVLNQLNNLVAKIQSRIAKMQSAGIDTSAANVSMTNTQSDIAIAENDLTALENGLAQPIATSTRNETIAALEIQSNTTKSDIQTAYASVIATIHLLAQEATTTQE